MNEAHEKGIEAAVSVHKTGTPYIKKYALEQMESAIKAYLQASGLVLVPREPTMEMELAGGLKCEGLMFEGDPEYTGVIFKDMGTVYKTMLNAAPNPFQSQTTLNTKDNRDE